MAARQFDEASLLTTLPKDISLSLEPCEDGGWLAQVTGIPSTESRGDTEEQAQQGALRTLLELMIARRQLALSRVQEVAPDSRGVSAENSEGAGVGVAMGVDIDVDS